MTTEDLCATTCIDEERVSRLQDNFVSDAMADRIAETFKALSDPTRVKIVFSLLHGELCVCEISEVIGMSQSAVSHQLRRLKDLRLVKRRKVAKMVYYSLDDDHILQFLTQCIDHVGEEFPGHTFTFQLNGIGESDGDK